MGHTPAAAFGRDVVADPDVAAVLERAADVYRERREGLVEALAERKIEAGASAGLTVWIPVPEEAPVVQSLLERGWAVSPGAPYRVQASARSGSRSAL